MRTMSPWIRLWPAALLGWTLTVQAQDEPSPLAAEQTTAPPEAIQRMIRGHGAAVLGQGTVGDLAFYVMQAGEQRQVFLLSPAGFLITGQVYGADGKKLLDTQSPAAPIPNLEALPAAQRPLTALQQEASEPGADDQARIQQALQVSKGPPGSDAVWQDLGVAQVIEEGLSDAPLVYIFFDPYCPYCHEQWVQLREAVRAQQYRIRWVPVAVLEPSRQDVGAVLGLLANPEPQALAHWMTDQTVARRDDSEAKLALIRNNVLFKRLQSSRVPTLLYQNAEGEIVMHSGVLSL